MASERKSKTLPTPGAYRARRGYTAVQLAVHAGLSPNAVKSVERGEDVNVRTLIAVALALGIRPSLMFAAWLNVQSTRETKA